MQNFFAKGGRLLDLYVRLSWWNRKWSEEACRLKTPLQISISRSEGDNDRKYAAWKGRFMLSGCIRNWQNTMEPKNAAWDSRNMFLGCNISLIKRQEPEELQPGKAGFMLPGCNTLNTRRFWGQNCSLMRQNLISRLQYYTVMTSRAVSITAWKDKIMLPGCILRLVGREREKLSPDAGNSIWCGIPSPLTRKNVRNTA